jgi:predicted  nucleic acid-binding Zn-ribbon protein
MKTNNKNEIAKIETQLKQIEARLEVLKRQKTEEDEVENLEKELLRLKRFRNELNTQIR